MPSHYLKQCWVNQSPRNKLQWNFNHNFENFHSRKCVWKYRLWNGGILFKERWVKISWWMYTSTNWANIGLGNYSLCVLHQTVICIDPNLLPSGPKSQYFREIYQLIYKSFHLKKMGKFKLSYPDLNMLTVMMPCPWINYFQSNVVCQLAIVQHGWYMRGLRWQELSTACIYNHILQYIV